MSKRITIENLKKLGLIKKSTLRVKIYRWRKLIRKSPVMKISKYQKEWRLDNSMSELWRRLGFLAFALLVYRIGTHIPIPGINPEQVAALFQQSQGTILQYFNLFSGGALERMSIFALSVVHIFQLLLSCSCFLIHFLTCKN